MSNKITKNAFQDHFRNKELRINDLQQENSLTPALKEAARSADTNRDGKISGSSETDKLFRALDRFDRDGNAQSMHRTTVLDAILGAATTNPPPPTADPNRAVRANFSFQPNAVALDRARSSDLGSKMSEKLEQHRDTYLKASALTGVPAELIAAIHANESGFGDYRPSVRGPESGFGLDDRHVSTAWGNSKLEQYGLGRWERGTGTERSIFQSAVIAAEHLKRNAAFAGIDIHAQMNANDLAGAALSYIQGTRAAENAHDRGSSWMFNTSDNNPHPLHPGGTSRTSSGRTVRVEPDRKEGLLRWDTLLPLIKEHLR